MVNVKKLIIASVASLGLMASAVAGPIDNYNATLNTPQAKSELLKSVCANPATYFTCENFKKNGVPTSDVRVGLVAFGVGAGAFGGMFVVLNPASVGYVGAAHVFGWYPTLAGATAAAAATGGVVAYAAAR